MAIKEQIKQHEDAVCQSISKRYAGCCPRCSHREKFCRHDIRRRTFYVDDECGEPIAVQTWLVRWRCCNCDARFTDYPPFAIPYKRHVKQAIYEMAEKVCRDHSSTYRSTAGDRAAPSSAWRWLTWLSDLWEQGNECLKFIINSNPNSILHRSAYSVNPRKHRSKKRASILERAFQTLDRIMAFERLVAEKYSPSLQHQHASE